MKQKNNKTNDLNEENNNSTGINKKKKTLIIRLIVILIEFLLIILGILVLTYVRNSQIAKPIIYLYPTTNEEITVKLGYSNKITTSYPKYTYGWNVLAKPNGDLLELNTNKKLYSLYYESDPVYNFKVEDNGFVVERKDVSDFLEKKLSILGLTERETEEFIIYWLPKLEKNKYNYIRFATLDEINKNMPLEINPNPDTTIRILMTFKKLSHPINVQEQNLEIPNRTGFVAVEWGGTEIK